MGSHIYGYPYICTYGNGALVVAPVICCHFVGECASSKTDASFMDVCRMYAYFCMQERVARALIWNARIESMKQTISKFCNTTQIFPSIVPPDCTLLEGTHQTLIQGAPPLISSFNFDQIKNEIQTKTTHERSLCDRYLWCYSLSPVTLQTTV